MKKLRMSVAGKILCLSAMFSFAGLNAHAGGFEQQNQSAAAMGAGNAFAATANDASALVYNPAGIAWLTGVTGTVGFDIEYRNSSVKLAGGIAPNTGVEPNAGSIFVAWSPLDSHWSGGIGFAPLYYINNDWSTAFGAAARIKKAGITKLTVDHTTFDGVYAINSSLAVGLGGDWYVSRATFTQGINSFRGSNFAGVGGHASVMWKPIYAWSLGAMVRSGATIDISGDGNDSMSFKLPDQVTVGLAHDFADVWRLETDVKWTRWSSLKNMNVTTGGVVTQSNPLDLKDTLTVMAGLTWTWSSNAQARLGYVYDQGANRLAGFSPVMADQDGHKVSVGVGGVYNHMHIDLAYQYGFYSKKTATGAFAGTYRDRRQSLMLSVSQSFE